MYHTFKDHQGSLAAVVHGNTVERLSHDPWGRRRNPAGFGYDNVSHTFDRGFTGHEHLSRFGLVNMDGRMYDPFTTSQWDVTTSGGGFDAGAWDNLYKTDNWWKGTMP